MKASIDNFSTASAQYAQFRPTYPAELYNYLFSRVQHFEQAWDCGTGNGQVALELVKRFQQVQATDLSANQIANANPHPHVQYGVCRAEASPFSLAQFDLITVAQALHWFDFEAFNREVRRVGKEGAFLAVWGYAQLQINPELDSLINHFYEHTIGSYWDEERRHVENAYADIPFPYAETERQHFVMTREWSLDLLCNYLRTWSSVKKYLAQHGVNPVDALQVELQKHWPDEADLPVHFPIFLQMGRL
jgi:hypothetical protein